MFYNRCRGRDKDCKSGLWVLDFLLDELEDAVLGILAQGAAEVLDVELHAGSEGDACVGIWVVSAISLSTLGAIFWNFSNTLNMNTVAKSIVIITIVTKNV